MSSVFLSFLIVGHLSFSIIPEPTAGDTPLALSALSTRCRS